MNIDKNLRCNQLFIRQDPDNNAIWLSLVVGFNTLEKAPEWVSYGLEPFALGLFESGEVPLICWQEVDDLDRFITDIFLFRETIVGDRGIPKVIESSFR